ncbi:MAG: ClpP family protease [bacterium]
MVHIRFFASVSPKTADSLMRVIDAKLKEGAERFVILISSGGGNVFSGITLYNYLRGIPAQVETHNFGSVDSVAVVLFCAGSKRFCVPHARFLLHGIGFDVKKPTRFDEKILDERLKGIRIDRQNIARVIAENSSKSVEEVERDMFTGITLNPEQAKEYGLVHEIRSELFEKGAEVITIGDQK